MIIRIDAAKELRRRIRMRESYTEFFINHAFPIINPGVELGYNWHIGLLCEYVQAAYLKQVQRLIITIPPRFLKSNIVTVGAPAWILGKNPAEKILSSSYAASLSVKHAVESRVLIEHKDYKGIFPETIITNDQNEKSKIVTSMRGHRIATSVGGTATGEGGNYLICDDPLKADEGMYSKTARENADTWYRQSWSTRKDDKRTAVEIIIMQRLSTHDIVGRREKQNYEIINIPQEAKSKIVYNLPISKKKIVRKKGELLHPDRFGPEQVAEAKADLGTRGYEAQHNQKPISDGGDRIKLDWFPRYRVIPNRLDKLVLSIDTAQKDKEINDDSAYSIFGMHKSNWLWLHNKAEKLNYPNLKRRVVALLDKAKRSGQPFDAILIEDKSSGSSLIQELNEEGNYPIIAIEPSGSKVFRLDRNTPSLEAGILYLPDPDFVSAPWLSDIEERLGEFPNPETWDSLDTLSQFLDWQKKHSTNIKIW